ncbi:hypothetical protein REPUB_Repub11eG0063600 [Reevesia pubescens]
MTKNGGLKEEELKEYPVGACKLSLPVLDLSNNSLTGLPTELGKSILFVVMSRQDDYSTKTFAQWQPFANSKKVLGIEGVICFISSVLLLHMALPTHFFLEVHWFLDLHLLY